MLLNHILKIEEAGGRKVAVRLDDRDECFINVGQSISIPLQREEEKWKKQKYREIIKIR